MVEKHWQREFREKQLLTAPTALCSTCCSSDVQSLPRSLTKRQHWPLLDIFRDTLSHSCSCSDNSPTRHVTSVSHAGVDPLQTVDEPPWTWTSSSNDGVEHHKPRTVVSICLSNGAMRHVDDVDGSFRHFSDLMMIDCRVSSTSKSVNLLPNLSYCKNVKPLGQ